MDDNILIIVTASFLGIFLGVAIAALFAIFSPKQRCGVISSSNVFTEFNVCVLSNNHQNHHMTADGRYFK